MKHFGLLKQKVYYNKLVFAPCSVRTCADRRVSTSLDSLHIGHFPMPDPSRVDPEVIKLGIHSKTPYFSVKAFPQPMAT